MKLTIIALSIFATAVAGFTTQNDMEENGKSFYDYKVNTIDGKEVSLSQYKGKKVLVVNVASKCGYTPQYADLQKLHETYGKDVTILAFPANNFGGQEPGSNEDIQEFCESNYGVKFQMFEKISCKGVDKHPSLQMAIRISRLTVPTTKSLSWNFCKYLIDENGKLVKFFPSRVNPMDEEIISLIKA